MYSDDRVLGEDERQRRLRFKPWRHSEKSLVDIEGDDTELVQGELSNRTSFNNFRELRRSVRRVDERTKVMSISKERKLW